jgi:hypothetical protein
LSSGPDETGERLQPGLRSRVESEGAGWEMFSLRVERA